MSERKKFMKLMKMEEQLKELNSFIKRSMMKWKFKERRTEKIKTTRK